MSKSNPSEKPTDTIVKVAVPVPLRKSFDYLAKQRLEPGTRVLVPFAGRTVVGVVVAGEPAQIAVALKPIKQVIDSCAVLSMSILNLAIWAANYYHHPIGEVIQTALPVKLRSAQPLANPFLVKHFYRQNDLGQLDLGKLLGRAPKQKQVFDKIPVGRGITLQQLLKQLVELNRSSITISLKNLAEKGMITAAKSAQQSSDSSGINNSSKIEFSGTLSHEQKSAIDKITQAKGAFSTLLLRGITGSGKTEVYLHAAESVISENQQVLVLVPEIALTPQLVERFCARLGGGVSVVHSAMSNNERYKTWCMANQGKACVVLGTRSAIFTPLKNPGLIIVDEEHDLSFKQRDGFRYHARDLAIKRGSLEHVPVVLGSATPSMETVQNVTLGRYCELRLSNRIGAAVLPKVELVDTRSHKAIDGLTLPLIERIADRLKSGDQTILYVNRRGYAPVAQCGACGWQATCNRCDAYLTYHESFGKLLCHYCGTSCSANHTCPQCAAGLFYSGLGTQRVEKALKQRFPHSRILRFDRDELTTQSALEEALNKIKLLEIDIVVGTQLISKGHDFPNVTLVGILLPDQSLYSIDFRAPEQLFQQLIQVSGRAGRGESQGNVIIQTAHPENHYYQLIHQYDFAGFYKICAQERAQLGFPPFGYLAMVRAESTVKAAGQRFLGFARDQANNLIRQNNLSGLHIMDPVPSPMEKLSDRFRAQLLVKSTSRKSLGQLMSAWMPALEAAKESRKIRWSLDIDPMELY